MASYLKCQQTEMCVNSAFAHNEVEPMPDTQDFLVLNNKYLKKKVLSPISYDKEAGRDTSDSTHSLLMKCA